MLIDSAHYQDGRRRDEGAVPLEEAAARCGQGGFVWLGLFEPGEEELAQVRDTFGLHELAVEDAQTFHRRPKIDCMTKTCGWSSCVPRATTAAPYSVP
jgi:magnesium transporter